MPKVFITLSLLLLAACDTDHGGRLKGEPGWAEKDVRAWTTALGYPNALYTCTTQPNYMIDDAASYAYCSVMIDGRVNLVFCDGQTNKCVAEK